MGTPKFKKGSDQKAASHSLSTDMLSTPMNDNHKAADKEIDEDDEADKMDCNSLTGLHCDQQSDLNDLHLYIAGSIEQSQEELQALIQQINSVTETIMNI